MQNRARLAIGRRHCQKPARICHVFYQGQALSDTPLPRRFCNNGPLRGRLRIPGDKSISHRALMFAALAVGTSEIRGMLEGEDVMATAAALRAFGAKIEKIPAAASGDGGRVMGTSIVRGDDEVWRVQGVGVGGLLQPGGALEMGNSGTSTRLLMGLVASHGISACFTGDASLSKRPMGRVIEPLSQMGASFESSPGGTLPLMMRGALPAVPITYRLPVASAQVKSAVLLAGLNTPGVTTVIEPVPTRDHSERMLKGFGADLWVEEVAGERVIRIRGEAELKPQNVTVPGDPSSAAFFIVATLLGDALIQSLSLLFVDALLDFLVWNFPFGRVFLFRVQALQHRAMPITAQKITTAPSKTFKDLSTSTVKSTWPGVSIILMRKSPQKQVVQAAVIVIPLSCS